MKSNLDLVNECDVFPYPEIDPTAHSAFLSTLYTLTHHSSSSTTPIPIGYLLSSVVDQLHKVPISIRGDLQINHEARTLSAFPFPTEAQRSQAVAATTAYWRSNKTFALLDGWRNELYPVYGPSNELLFSIERSASPLFGIVTYGVHMTAYTRVPSASHGLKMWVPRRAATKQTYGGMLDNTVAGGIATGEAVWESMVRECEEEASLSLDVVRRAEAKGSVTYTHVRDSRAGGESGCVQPECQWVFDLELDDGVVPRPNDSEVQEFYLWSVEEVREALGKGEFKPNCALVILDFFIRRGILTEENERDYQEIKRRLHRNLEFPGPHRV